MSLDYIRRMKCLTTVALLLLATTLQAVEPTTVILIRHAEKDPADKGKDPELSAVGTARADELARVLAAVKVSAIYSTPFKRTENTVAPLAAAAGVTTVVLPSAKTYVADVVSAIRTKHVGSSVIVVGHSNTTPEVIRALGVEDVPSIPDSQYDDLFIVTLVDGAKPVMVHLKYGAVTGTPAAVPASSLPVRTRMPVAAVSARCMPFR